MKNREGEEKEEEENSVGSVLQKLIDTEAAIFSPFESCNWRLRNPLPLEYSAETFVSQISSNSEIYVPAVYYIPMILY